MDGLHNGVIMTAVAASRLDPRTAPIATSAVCALRRLAERDGPAILLLLVILTTVLVERGG